MPNPKASEYLQMSDEQLLDRVNKAKFESEWPVVHAAIKLKHIQSNIELSKAASSQQTWLTVSTVILATVTVIQFISLLALAK